MEHLEIWKVAIDMALAFSLGYLCVRLILNPSALATSREVQQLEGTLRSLIEDASHSGKTLNDSLNRRQNDLERLLIDINSAELRVSKALSSIDSRRSSPNPELAISESRSRASEYEAGQNHYENAAASRSNRRELEVELAAQYAAPEPPSFSAPSVAPNSSTSAPKRTSASRKVNIYGEEISESESGNFAPAPRAPQAYSPLRAKIEREMVEQSPIASPPSRPIEDVYSAAEEMLRAGEDVQRIAAKTDLPTADLEMLAQVVRREKQTQAAVKQPLGNLIEVEPEQAIEQPAVAPNDPRLGVLGGAIKRQIQVL